MKEREEAGLLREAERLSGELERRYREDRLKYYRPHEKQRMFHECPKKNRWALGGNRTGKTEAGAAECVWLARGNHPYRQTIRPMNGWVVSLTAEMQRDVAQKKLMSYVNPEWIRGVRMREGRADDPEGGMIDYIQIECVHGGVSTIGFKNCAQGREKFQGTSQDFIWFDEEPPEEIYHECLMRTLDSGGLIFGTMTPLKGMTWVYNTVYLNEANDPNVWYVTMSWEDNPYLSSEAVAQMTRALSEEELSARKHGRFVAMSGLVYGEFDERVHVIEPFDVPREWQDMISIDPGMTKPLSCHWYAVDHDGNVYVVAEHYRAGLSVEEHMEEIEEISRVLDWKRDSGGRLSALMDAAADQHTLQAEKSVAELFRELGMNVNTRVNKSKWAGIQRVRQYLKKRDAFDKERWPEGKPSLFIFDCCPMMIREIKQYRWRLDGESEEPVKKDDHAMDELRYYLMHRGEIAQTGSVLREGAILAHKKKLAKKLGRGRR